MHIPPHTHIRVQVSWEYSKVQILHTFVSRPKSEPHNRINVRFTTTCVASCCIVSCLSFPVFDSHIDHVIISGVRVIKNAGDLHLAWGRTVLFHAGEHFFRVFCPISRKFCGQGGCVRLRMSRVYHGVHSHVAWLTRDTKIRCTIHRCATTLGHSQLH